MALINNGNFVLLLIRIYVKNGDGELINYEHLLLQTQKNRLVDKFILRFCQKKYHMI